MKAAYQGGQRINGRLSQIWPQLIRARTEKITIAITAYCNLRCTGCRYGRDFMPGRQLPFEIVEGVGGIPELAGQSEGVGLIPSGRPAKIMQAILELADPVDRARAGAANRRAAAGYTIDCQARAYALIYEQLANVPRKERRRGEGERLWADSTMP